MDQFGRCLHHLLEDYIHVTTYLIFRSSVDRWRHKIRKLCGKFPKHKQSAAVQFVPNTLHDYYWDRN